MTTHDRPSPPDDLDRELQEQLAALETYDPDRLRAVGRYLEELAAWKASTDESHATASTDAAADGIDAIEREASERSDRNGDEDTADGVDDADVEYPADVPERASVTVKEIAGTTYYYYQWRDGDRIESKTVQR